MKTFYFILSLFCMIAGSTNSYAQNVQMPGYEEVAKHFFYTYEVPPSFPDNNVFQFHKKVDGWHIAEVDQQSKKTIKSGLFWNRNTNAFHKLSYEAATDTSKAGINFSKNTANSGIGEFELYAYERISFYGYSGWDWDVIQHVKPEPKISDFELESLARAYANYASGFLFDQYGYHFENNDTARKDIKNLNPISPYRASRFAEYIKKSIEYYTLLAEKHPNYETRVGKAQIKLSGEHMFAWSTLKMIGFESKATEFLKEGLYNDSILQIAEKFLNDAPQNSILFTSGDNHTYAIWYMQEMKGLRKDVKAIDISLLGLSRYIAFLQQKENINFSIPDSIIHHKSFGVLYKHPTKSIPRGASVDELIQQITTNIAPVSELSAYSGSRDSIRYFTNERFYFDAQKPSVNDVLVISEVKVVNLEAYIYGSDLLLLDLINTNRFTKKIVTTFRFDILNPVLISYKSLYIFSEK